jgi:hypothetical protein
LGWRDRTDRVPIQIEIATIILSTSRTLVPVTRSNKRVMLGIYYKIWISLFVKINERYETINGSILLSLLVLTGINILNYFFICILLITLFDVNINFLHQFYLNNRYFDIIAGSLIPFLFNYFLLVFNKKHEHLLELYANRNLKNLGRNYYLFSFLIIVLYLFLIILFPAFFGLKG